MAVTGVVLIGFVIAHMLGNLKIFSGPDEINAYSRFLRDVGQPELSYGQLLWIVRTVLLICVALHNKVFENWEVKHAIRSRRNLPTFA
jgi:succinate dehydrogenase / fumarate reductase, cytochrome b subunit